MLDIEWVNPTTLTELVLLALAFILSAIIGLERHRQVKSAGLRTHTFVGVGSALFTLVSAYGFATVNPDPSVTVDPTRIAAQIVSGIGFLGAGVIFVRQNVVSGLTTAASIWLVAAIGMACGAGMPVLAVAGTVLYLFGMGLLSRVARRIPTRGHRRDVCIYYKDGRGVLRAVLQRASELGFEVTLASTERSQIHGKAPVIAAHLRFNRGRITVNELLEQLSNLKGVQRITNPEYDETKF